MAIFSLWGRFFYNFIAFYEQHLNCVFSVLAICTVVVVVVVVVVAMNIIKVALLQYMLQYHRTNVTIKTVKTVYGSQYTSGSVRE